MNPKPANLHQQETAASSPNEDVSSLYTVERADRSFFGAITRRSKPVRPLPGVDYASANWMKVQAYNHAGLSEYNPCWTGEMWRRPIPFISTDDRPRAVQELVKKHFPTVLDFLGPRMKPGYQPINKISRLGYPINSNPGEGRDKQGVKRFPSKFEVVMESYESCLAGDWSMFEGAYLTQGRRLQIEEPSKVRVFQFINADGVCYQTKVNGSGRTIEVPELGKMIGSRTRVITQPPVYNLLLQCFDSVLHSAILEYPLCDSNMYNHKKWAQDTHFVTFDCKHYERYLGMAAESYASIIGGIYGEKLLEMIYMRSLVPSDDWKTAWFIRPAFGPGVYPQFNSGICAVATIGKVANICVQMEYFHATGLRGDELVMAVLSGQSTGLQRWMYGDDNRVTGDQQQIDAFVSFMGSYFEIEVDDEPKYLGMRFVPEKGEFMLPTKTYVTKQYQPERDHSFRTYPYLGLVERRKVFQQYGEPEISSTVIPFEDSLWDEIGDPFTRIITMAAREQYEANRAGIHLNQWEVSDKGYLMTAQEELKTGLFWHVPPDAVAGIINKLVGVELRQRLSFRNDTAIKLPKPAAKTINIYDTYNSKEEEDTEGLSESQ